MKTFIFFLLVPVTLADGVTENALCLSKALESIPDFLLKSKEFCCEFGGDMNDYNNQQNYEEAGKSYINILNSMGCSADKILGSGKTFQQITQLTGQALVDIFRAAAVNILDALHLSKSTFGLVCKLLGNTMASTCLKTILADNSIEALQKIDKLICEANPSALSADDMIVILVNLACLGDDALDCRDDLKNTAVEVSNDIRGMLQITLTTLQGTDVKLSGLTAPLCQVLKTLLVKTPLGGVGRNYLI